MGAQASDTAGGAGAALVGAAAQVGGIDAAGGAGTALVRIGAEPVSPLQPGVRPPGFADVVRRALRPPLHERRFWVIQAMVVLLAGLHLVVDLTSSTETSAFPGGIPVALLIVPVAYAAMRYGLAGSAATGAWATLLWLPDLLLPLNEGHAPSDLVNLALVDVVALFFGQQIEAERLARVHIERATAERLTAEAGYRQLFETNGAPILVLDQEGIVQGANPAAIALFGAAAIGAAVSTLIGDTAPLEALSGRVLTLGDGRDYRAGLVALPATGTAAAAQLILEDVTEERSESRRATRYTAMMVAAEEDQRRRLARELHDEPLQLFLHLARRLENLSGAPGVPAPVAVSLDEARAQSLEAARRLRNLARDLRPPALDQLGLVAALSSFLAEAEEGSGLVVELEVSGTERRLLPEVELSAFRIVQEAVRNTVAHAHAHEVRVGVTFDDCVVLTVADDGQGFARQEGGDAATEHLGLRGMAERASLHGGSLEVRTAPGEGTVVRASLPAERAVHGAALGA